MDKSALNCGPVGIFDSGLGGLTVFESILKTLPEYDYIYLGDNARAPYGTRSQEIIYRYTLQGVKKLFSLGCPLVILACNTASAKALRRIQQEDLPRMDARRRVLGVIRPSAEFVARHSDLKNVGILGTEGTVSSRIYPDEINDLDQEIRVEQEACPMWVPLVECGETHTPAADYFVRRHCEALLSKLPDPDAVVLGCTHYPVLLPLIQKYFPEKTRIIDQGPVVAGSLKDYLQRHPEMASRCSRGGTHHYYSSGDVDSFNKQAGRFFDGPVNAEHIDWDE